MSAIMTAGTMVGRISLLVSAHLALPDWLLLALCGLSGLRLVFRDEIACTVSFTEPGLLA